MAKKREKWIPSEELVEAYGAAVVAAIPILNAANLDQQNREYANRIVFRFLVLMRESLEAAEDEDRNGAKP